jgi:hypothetical protein
MDLKHDEMLNVQITKVSLVYETRQIWRIIVLG